MAEQKNKYRFDQNFYGSSISDQSQDIIIVEPLDQEQLAINKSNLTGINGQSFSKFNNNRFNQQYINSDDDENDNVIINETKQQNQINTQIHNQLIHSQLQTSQFNNQQSQIIEMIIIYKGLVKLNPELETIFTNDQNQIVLVGILGQNKSGKSQLLNEISQNNINGFGNQGIWITKIPLIIQDKSYYFIDCTTDNQLLCAFLMLTCSKLLYNTILLDENSIWCFPVLDTLLRFFNNGYALTQLLPDFIWVQRDKQQPKPIIELKQYLLKANKGQLFENLIHSHDVAHIAPLNSSKYQPSISQLKNNQIFNGISKSINGFNLNGSLIYYYMKYIIELLNQPKTLQIQSIWLNITEEYTKQIYNQCLNEYDQMITNLINDSERLDEKKIYFKFRDFKDQIVYKTLIRCYLNNKNRFYYEYKKQLLQYIETKEQNTLQQYSLICLSENEPKIKQTLDKLSLNDLKTFTQHFNQMLDQLIKQRCQFKLSTAFTQSMTKNYNKLLEQLFINYQSNQNDEEYLFLIQQLKQGIQNSKVELDKKKADVTLQDKRKTQTIKEIKDLQDQIKIERDTAIQSSNQQQLEEQIFKLRQEKAQNITEINLLKKQLLALQQRKQQQSDCLIF